MGFVVAAVLGVVLFDEALTIRNIAGLCAATIALRLLAIGN
jgi:multidrug transporter EmrE-like cation transporter